MPVTRAEELDARPADTAKELLALADDYAAGLQKMIESGYEEFGPRVQRNHQLIIDALRLSARQQASVESIRRLAQSRADFWREQSLKNTDRGTHYEVVAGQFQNIADALAKYDIFEKVEG